jgi:hypothetical protein
MKLKDASFSIRIYSFFMSNNKVRSPLTDMTNIFMTWYEIVFRINKIKNNIYKQNKKTILMSENGLCKLFPISEIKILISVTGLHNKATY